MRLYNVKYTNGGKGIIYMLAYSYYKMSIPQCTHEPKKLCKIIMWVRHANFMKYSCVLDIFYNMVTQTHKKMLSSNSVI